MNELRVEVLENQLRETNEQVVCMKRSPLLATSISAVALCVGFQPAGPARIIEATHRPEDKDKKCHARLFFNDAGSPHWHSTTRTGRAEQRSAFGGSRRAFGI